MIAAKAVSPVEVVDHFLGRIEEHQPVLRAFDHMDTHRARREAKDAEAAVLAGDALGPLYGVPTAVKSHLDIAGVRQTIPFGVDIARRDDPVVSRLRGAGAIVIGHTRMPVFAADGLLDYVTTSRNAWDPGRTPGISSAGSAAAVSAGLLPAAIASDGGGSTRLPAAYSGLIGVHPTAGMVPWVDPRGQTTSYTSTTGPITRDVRDAAMMLSVIAGADPRDQAGLQLDLPDPRSELGQGGEGLSLAWTDDFGFALNYAVDESPRVIAHLRAAAFAATATGATIEATDEVWEDYVAAFHTYSVAGVASMGIPGVGVVSDDDWDAAAGVRERHWNRFRRLFGRYDLLLCPTIHSVAPTIEVLAERIPTGLSILLGGPGPDSYAVYTAQFNWLRFPATSVPCGFVDGLPVGLQIVGPPGSDARVLRPPLAG
jgi:Asp-tRNA(Asn)/Glu-tRNA(Gln) amidotransferase A subunit family amidase